jgi:hypothetical protein
VIHSPNRLINKRVGRYPRKTATFYSGVFAVMKSGFVKDFRQWLHNHKRRAQQGLPFVYGAGEACSGPGLFFAKSSNSG